MCVLLNLSELVVVVFMILWRNFDRIANFFYQLRQRTCSSLVKKIKIKCIERLLMLFISEIIFFECVGNYDEIFFFWMNIFLLRQKTDDDFYCSLKEFFHIFFFAQKNKLRFLGFFCWIHIFGNIFCFFLNFCWYKTQGQRKFSIQDWLCFLSRVSYIQKTGFFI